jgi:anthranilate phosphoribosyltransferase
VHEAVGALLAGRGVDRATWRSLWDELGNDGLGPGEATALLASLSTCLPGPETLAALVASLDERRPEPPYRFARAVNIVGTGGGPPTFNVSTAAAFTAAAIGVPVVKTGSRAYMSSVGSIDLLERLGVPLTKSHGQTAETLERVGVAFAGYFVYPRELPLLARRVMPLGLRPFGRFLNAVGPFLAALPVSAQVTGVSDRSLLPALRALATATTDRTVWLCTNGLGADELLGFADNVIEPNDGTGEITLATAPLGLGAGSLDDVRPAPADGVVDHFLAVVSGEGGEAATHAVCLNAAAMAVAGGHADDWADAVAAARDALRGGAARELVERVRFRPPRPASLSGAGSGG